MCGEGGNLSTRDLSFIYVSSAGRVGCEFLHAAQPTDATSSRRSSRSHFYTPGFPRGRSHDMIFHPIFPCDMLSAKILWCEHKSRIKKSFQNQLALYFHRQSNENRIMRTVKEIRSDFNWSIYLENILMFTCFLIFKISFCHLVYFRLSPLFRIGFCNISKEYENKPIIYDMSSVISILSSSCVTQTSIYLN